MTFRVDVSNQQRVKDTNEDNDEGCEYDYKGTVNIINNRIGLLGRDTIVVDGAKKVYMKDNA